MIFRITLLKSVVFRKIHAYILSLYWILNDFKSRYRLYMNYFVYFNATFCNFHAIYEIKIVYFDQQYIYGFSSSYLSNGNKINQKRFSLSYIYIASNDGICKRTVYPLRENQTILEYLNPNIQKLKFPLQLQSAFFNS